MKRGRICTKSNNSISQNVGWEWNIAQVNWTIKVKVQHGAKVINMEPENTPKDRPTKKRSHERREAGRNRSTQIVANLCASIYYSPLHPKWTAVIDAIKRNNYLIRKRIYNAHTICIDSTVISYAFFPIFYSIFANNSCITISVWHIQREKERCITREWSDGDYGNRILARKRCNLRIKMLDKSILRRDEREKKIKSKWGRY